MGSRGYTKISDAQLRGLHEAGASANEILAYEVLTRYHNDEARPGRCYVSAQLASDVTGIGEGPIGRALRSLCGKAFTTDESGAPVYVLRHVSKGHNGRAATYNDNLFELSEAGRYPVAGQYRPATGTVAGQNRPATDTSSRADAAGYGAGRSRAARSQLQGSPAAPDKGEPLATQPNEQGLGTEGRTGGTIPHVSTEDAPLDSCGMTEDERDAFYRDWY